jgi:hypothetical protein
MCWPCRMRWTRSSGEVEISGIVSDQLVSQRNAIHPVSPHCFFRDRATMQGAQAGGCGCHAVQSALGDAVRDNATIAGGIACMDDACPFLRTKLISRVIGFRPPVTSMTR